MTNSSVVAVATIVLWGALVVVADESAPKYFAGVIPYSVDEDGDVALLFGEEPRSDVRHSDANPRRLRWKAFSGKADKGDQSEAATAAREFDQETRYVFRNANFDVRDHLKKAKKFKHARHNTFLYLVMVKYIPANKFNKAPKDEHTEMERYTWVKLKTLLAEVDKVKADPAHKGTTNDRQGRTIPLARFHLSLTNETVPSGIKGNRQVYPNTYDFLLDPKSRPALERILKPPVPN